MVEGWRFDLLNRDGQTVGELSNAVGGSLEWSIFRGVPGSGTLTLDNPDRPVGGRTPNWLTDRIRATALLDGVEYPLGVWLVTRPSTATNIPDRLNHATLSLLDKTHLLNQPAGVWVSFPAGTDVDVAVRDIVTNRTHEPVTGISETWAELSSAMTFEPDKTWLHIVNQLMQAAGHSSLHASRQGLLTSNPYTAPGDRPLTASYGPRDGDLVMLPQWDDDLNLHHIPNVVTVATDGTEDEPGYIGVAVNDSPTDPLSTINRGEVLVHESADAATSQEAANTIAARRLDSLSQVTRRATITHPLDGTWLDDVVEHYGAGFTGPIVQRSIVIGVGPVVTSTVRRIYTGLEVGDLV